LTSPLASNADLHLHTWFSDGRASPEEILEYAAEHDITTLAITDHDNTGGYRAARLIAGSQGIELIPAMEITCRWDACAFEPDGDSPKISPDVDLLAYFIDVDLPVFREFEQSLLQDIRERLDMACQRLTADGYPVSMDELLELNPRYIGTLHLIETLVKKKLVDRWKTGADLLDRIWPEIRPSRLPIEDAISNIHAVGGVAVLAHPATINCNGGWVGAQELGYLVRYGLDGVEIYHHRLNAAARTHFTSLARRLGLLLTGGSDEHGWPEGLTHLGTQPVPPQMITALYKRAYGRRRK
jgi:predicted metal-dependent phosphoesterase TrpH